MFTVEERNALSERVLRLAEEDERVVAGAACRARARAEHLPRVPVAGRAAVGPVDDATAQFRPAGPRFRLLFGETAAGESEVPTPPVAGDLFIPTPPIAEDIFGWGVIYALHARACIERGRVWQAEHYVGAVRDLALSLACLRQSLPAVQARGYDDISAETLARFEDSHVGAVEPAALRAALGASVHALTREGADARLPHAHVVAERLAELR